MVHIIIIILITGLEIWNSLHLSPTIYKPALANQKQQNRQRVIDSKPGNFSHLKVCFENKSKAAPNKCISYF